MQEETRPRARLARVLVRVGVGVRVVVLLAVLSRVGGLLVSTLLPVLPRVLAVLGEQAAA